jgi:hypothetical protein
MNGMILMNEIEGIYKNFEILEKIKQLIKTEKNTKEKINLIKIASYFASYNHTGLFSDDFLERELIKIANSIKEKVSCSPEVNSFLHVATSVYKFGGHTKLIERFVKFSDKNSKHSLVLTKQDGEVPDWLTNTILNKNGKIFQLKGSDLEKAKVLREKASKYEKIILHIHPFDVIPVLAFGTEKFKQPVIFYNHADHLFWIGVSISDLVLDLSSGGKELSNKKRGIKNSKILPVPVDCREKSVLTKEKARKTLNLPMDKKIIISIGTPDKFQPFGKFNFIEKSFEIINNIKDVIVVVVGPSKKEKMWKRAFEKSKGKIIPVGIIDKEKLFYYIKSADIYLESFPFSSSTATVEVMLLDVPAVVVKMEEKKWDVLDKISIDVEDIVPEIRKILEKGDYKKEIIDDIKKFHCEKSWRNNLEKILVNDKHKVSINFKGNSTIEEYDIYLYQLLEKENMLLYLSAFVQLSLKNKLKILKIFIEHPKFKSMIKKYSIKI